MMMLGLLLLLGGLLAIVAAVQVVAARWSLPESILLAVVGIVLGGALAVAGQIWPTLPDQLPTLNLSAQAYLWLFLPPLLFQASMSADVRALLPDTAPILMLAVVAVFVATAVVGLAMSLFGAASLAACLLLGAVIATTDPSAVLAIFHNVGAPPRLIRLVEGESLLNDAAAIAVASVLIAMLAGHDQHAGWGAGLRTLLWSFGGGVVVGVLFGRLLGFLLAHSAGLVTAEAALTLALPYPLYLLAEHWLEVSGVVAVVSAGLVINALLRTRLSPRNFEHLQLLWEQVARIASAIAFLVATVRIPDLLHGATWQDGGLLVVLVIAATLARLLVLFGLLPILSWLRLSEPVSGAYKLALTWGGLRGAVTLVLALGISQNSALPPEVRRLVAILATSFVLCSLLINGSSLRWVIHRLGLDRLSPSEQALQQQSIGLATVEVERSLEGMAAAFGIGAESAEYAARQFRLDMAIGSAPLNLELGLPERERFAVGLVMLASRERDLIPEYGSGVISVKNLDAMMRNTGLMIDGARSEGRMGYSRAARKILDASFSYRVALWLHRHARIHVPLARHLADRFELLICRRAVLERLLRYNQTLLVPLLGERMAAALESVLRVRADSVTERIASMRQEFGGFTEALERRLLLLFALRRARNALERMSSEGSLSKEAHAQLDSELAASWRRALVRPRLRASLKTGSLDRPVASAAPPIWADQRPAVEAGVPNEGSSESGEVRPDTNPPAAESAETLVDPLVDSQRSPMEQAKPWEEPSAPPMDGPPAS